VLNLPEAFGSAYVGETFSCTLCANNELLSSDKTRTVTGVRIQGDMQTPSMPSGSPLELSGPEGAEKGDDEGREDIGPGESLQRILRFELKEEGNHVLAVTVTYTETLLAGQGRAASGRVRTFRKLYQFVAQQLLSVRTKTGEVGVREGRERFLLEAQLENMGESAVSLEVRCIQGPCAIARTFSALVGSLRVTQTVEVNAKPPFVSTSLNEDLHLAEKSLSNAPVLNPRDVVQVAFLLEQMKNTEDENHDSRSLPPGDAKTMLGQLAIQWRGSLGERGSLSTGWLSCRR
jgi:hypothetical protein